MVVIKRIDFITVFMVVGDVFDLQGCKLQKQMSNRW